MDGTVLVAREPTVCGTSVMSHGPHIGGPDRLLIKPARWAQAGLGTRDDEKGGRDDAVQILVQEQGVVQLLERLDQCTGGGWIVRAVENYQGIVVDRLKARGPRDRLQPFLEFQLHVKQVNQDFERGNGDGAVLSLAFAE